MVVPASQVDLLPRESHLMASDFRGSTSSLLRTEQKERYDQADANSVSFEKLSISPPSRKTSQSAGRYRDRSPGSLDIDDGQSLNDERPTDEANGEGGPNLNRRYEYMPESMVPIWYNKSPKINSQGSGGYLCGTCRHINMVALFKQKVSKETPSIREYIALGTPSKLLEGVTKRCGLCSLAARIIAADTGIDLPTTMSEDQIRAKKKERMNAILDKDDSYYLCPIRFPSTFNDPKLYICSGEDLRKATKDLSSHVPRGSMAIRWISNTSPNFGRLLRNPDRIDFGWIRERMQLCDERDVGKLDYRHGIEIRVIDVHRMCLASIPDGARYVTLSYTWGRVKQFVLTKKNESSLWYDGSLQCEWNHVPKTIQDSIKLVREIGERYLWVDAICIIQDDPQDQQEQIAEMGDIYGNSILTICICCGEDASYGIPGIESGTRKTFQVIELVGKLAIGNDILDSSDTTNIKWNTRAWTMQEKVLSQRKLQIYDNCVNWWCWHTNTSEDEYCQHTLWETGASHRPMYFYKTTHDLVVSKIENNSNMDIYAFMVSDYTERHLTYPADAERAVSGAFNAIKSTFGGNFEAGLPDTELAAALLWVPLGSSRRRIDPKTQRPMFPSWSWLGWEGHAAYPWLIERTMPMSEDGSPVLWGNAHSWAINYDPDREMGQRGEPIYWFTGDQCRKGIALGKQKYDYGRWSVDDVDGWSYVDSEDPEHRWLHPVDESVRQRSHTFGFFRSGPTSDIKRLFLRTLSATFYLNSVVEARKTKHDYLHTVHQVRILNAKGLCVGYIYAPDPETFSADQLNSFTGETSREFIVLSRASTNSDPRIGQELLRTPLRGLHSVYSMAYMSGALARGHMEGEDTYDVAPYLDEHAHFDTRLYDATTPWGLFNVMMIEHKGELAPELHGKQHPVAERIAIGRIHVAAFMEAEPEWTCVSLE